MIAQLSGTVLTLGGNWLVVSVGGVGFTVWCPPQTVMGARIGSDLTIHTSLVVREDSLTLYGFAASTERDSFELLLSVSGVGPKLALAVVSVMSPEELAAAVSHEQVTALTRVPGIGPKGAQRLILELKDKVSALAVEPSTAVPDTSEPWRGQVRDGLIGLGWSAKEAEAVCEKIAPQAEEGATLAVLMRTALQQLAKR